ncbi:hypothetical protein MACK_002654 [Theileria orientalis]|uniref:AP2/ERF domain-containing protein n=1 Tax=Theileria orientalis TaxID=68886 RepID=A0A976MDX7_THEOR|nr:hypothetical protein MACK_002654 [Theileria orientalis]
MPGTRLLSRKAAGYDTVEAPGSGSKKNTEIKRDHTAGVDDSINNQLTQLGPQAQTLHPNQNPNSKSDNMKQLGFENTKQMMPVQPSFIQQINHQGGQNHQTPMNQNQHGMINHPNMQMQMNHPGFPPMMGFQMFQPSLNTLNNMNNMSEFAYLPTMRFSSKDLAGMDQMTPQAVLGRLGGHPMPPATFAPQPPPGQYGSAAHYSQFFDKKDESRTDLAYLEYSGGVVYDNGSYSNGGRWLTFWEYKGRIWRKSFPVSLFGSQGAKELAENFWVSKMRSIQLFNRHKHEKVLKAEKKTESRGRKKKVTKTQEGPMPHLSLDPTLAAQYILQDQSKREKEMARKEAQEEETPDFKVREPRVVKADIEGLSWDAETSTWSFQKVENNELTTFKLECNERNEGLEKIVKLREEYETNLLKEYVEPGKSKGLIYDKTKMNWKVTHWIPSKGIKRNKLFSITRLGYKQALEAALAYKEAVDENGGEEPEDVMPDPVPQDELFQDPMVEHYHNVLRSIAVRQVKDGLS